MPKKLHEKSSNPQNNINPRENSIKNNHQIQDANYRRPIRLVVALHKNPQLVQALYDSLEKCIDELKRLKCQIYFYIDSPEDVDLINVINSSVNTGNLNINLIYNKQNIGFVLTANQAIEDAVRCHSDIILLNSDAQIFPGCLTEMARVAYLDPMIGFVSPRSNNATICNLPHDSDTSYVSPMMHFSRFQTASRYLPDYSYVPTAVGFCLFIKWNILSEFGGFDPIYGKGYNEENDLIMRANKSGFRAVLANKAFAHHIGEVSFSQSDNNRKSLDEVNKKVVINRYPHYEKLIRKYSESPEFLAEKLLSPLVNINSLNICFDLSSFGPHHNGTIEAGLATLKAACLAWPDSIEISVFISQEAWDFHSLDEEPRLQRIDPDQNIKIYSAVIKYGQPFSVDSVSSVLLSSPLIAFFMLDTISADCGHLSIDLDENLWHFVMKWSDLVFTNSSLTTEQLTKRYRVGDKTTLLPVLHSIDPNDYINKDEKGNFSSPLLANINLDSSILLVGNKFPHKYINETISALTKQLPKIPFIVLGNESSVGGNVMNIESGGLSPQDIDLLYSRVRAVIFPSQYEGFGLPVMHSLARKKPIYIRRLPPFEEIASKLIQGQENIHWYESTQNLIEQLSHGVQEWQGEDIVGEHAGWTRSANQILGAIVKKIGHIEYNHLVDRIRYFDCFQNSRSHSYQLTIISDKYQTELVRNNHISHNLNSVYSSNSWKITAPLRKIKELYLHFQKK